MTLWRTAASFYTIRIFRRATELTCRASKTRKIGELSPEQKEELKRFHETWRDLDERTQTKYLAEVVQEVVFDPDAKTIPVTLFDRQAETFLATSDIEQSDLV